ncbi:hypothetical protein P9112_012950 [Eukaryota sp. TZLM1-RC]
MAPSKQIGQIGAYTEEDVQEDVKQLGWQASGICLSITIGIILFITAHSFFDSIGMPDFDFALLPWSTVPLNNYRSDYARSVWFNGLTAGYGYLCHGNLNTYSVSPFTLRFKHDNFKNKRFDSFYLNQGSQVDTDITIADASFLTIKSLQELAYWISGNTDFRPYEYEMRKGSLVVSESELYTFAYTSSSGGHVDADLTFHLDVHDVSSCKEICNYYSDASCVIDLDEEGFIVVKGADEQSYPQEVEVRVSRALTLQRVKEIGAIVFFVGGVIWLLFYQVNKQLANRDRRQGIKEMSNAVSNPVYNV